MIFKINKITNLEIYYYYTKSILRFFFYKFFDYLIVKNFSLSSLKALLNVLRMQKYEYWINVLSSSKEINMFMCFKLLLMYLLRDILKIFNTQKSKS